MQLQSWAQAGAIPATSSPQIDGCNSYRLEKTKLLQWRQERICEEEASRVPLVPCWHVTVVQQASDNLCNKRRIQHRTLRTGPRLRPIVLQ